MAEEWTGEVAAWGRVVANVNPCGNGGGPVWERAARVKVRGGQVTF